MKKRRKPTESLWQGPEKSGISYSLLSKFLTCRERFRLRVVEGLREESDYNHYLEYGSMWHEGEEAHSAGKPWKKAVSKYYNQLRAQYPAQVGEIRRTFNIVCAAFPTYINWWKSHHVERNRVPLLEEEVFEVPYELPSGRTVILRGKFDCVYSSGRTVWLQENKTKGEIDEKGLQGSLQGNLQTMLYQIALRRFLPRKQADKVKGVLYNVVRRPLGERQKHCIRQRKTETEKQFYKRLTEVIEEHAEYFFMRWKVTLQRSDIKAFEHTVFIPVLEQLCDWWEWIAVDPFNPWRIHADTGIPGGGVHWQSPWGVFPWGTYTPMFRGDYFDLLTTGSKRNLKRIDNLFPELHP